MIRFLTIMGSLVALSVVFGAVISNPLLPFLTGCALGLITVVFVLIADNKRFRMGAKEYIFVITRAENGIYKYHCKVYAKSFPYYVFGLCGPAEIINARGYGNTIESSYDDARSSLKDIIEAYEENERKVPEIRVVLRSDILGE